MSGRDRVQISDLLFVAYGGAHLTWLSFPVKTGLTSLEKGGFFYVSRGTGVWGPPIRFLASPEITIIESCSGIDCYKELT
jgi:predicted MPP superfamily phosphohydrolase